MTNEIIRFSIGFVKTKNGDERAETLLPLSLQLSSVEIIFLAAHSYKRSI